MVMGPCRSGPGPCSSLNHFMHMDRSVPTESHCGGLHTLVVATEPFGSRTQILFSRELCTTDGAAQPHDHARVALGSYVVVPLAAPAPAPAPVDGVAGVAVPRDLAVAALPPSLRCSSYRRRSRVMASNLSTAFAVSSCGRKRGEFFVFGGGGHTRGITCGYGTGAGCGRCGEHRGAVKSSSREEGPRRPYGMAGRQCCCGCVSNDICIPKTARCQL